MAITHRTASGKSIDMSALAAKNQKVRAVSNMSMNARGDIIDSNNNIVAPVSQRVSRTYNNTTVNPTAHEDKAAAKPTVAPTHMKPTPDQPKTVAQAAPIVQEVKKEEPPVVFLEDMSEDEIEFFDEFDQGVPEKTETKSKKK